MTAASGGNREELLGPRPAGCERQRSRRWEPQPGQWHRAAMTERASPSPGSRHAAISCLFGRAMLSLRLRFFVSFLALSVTFGDSSPRGRALGMSVSFRLDAESPTGRKRAGLATEGSSFWTSAPCQAVAGLDSGALPFPGHRASLVQWKPDRHASGSPFGGAGAERLRGQGCCQTALRSDRIALTTSLLIAAQRLSGDRLALSVTPVACHLSQRERLWLAASLPLSFCRSLWYTYFAALPAY